ncbi:MAG: methylated-DNA--[protein]-cysteine S-methyltransferase [Polyangiales bacterium]
MTLSMTYLVSPVGGLTLFADDRALVAIAFNEQLRGSGADARDDPAHPVLTRARAELEEYFAGDRKTFTIPLGARGTAFQQRVWDALAEIPWGETRSYGDIARRIGNPKGVRAVGLANGRNPLPIVVPCHRVIGSDGSLTGYGGGLPIKVKLLGLEGISTPGL